MNKLQRTIVLLSSEPTTAQAEGIAAQKARDAFESESFSFEVSHVLPLNLDDETKQQLSDLKKEAGPQAVFLIIHNKATK